MNDEKKPFDWVAGVEAQMRKELLGDKPSTDPERRATMAEDKVLETDGDGNHTGNGICPYCEAHWKDGLVVSPVA